jgi:hypothetical protein
LATHPAWATVEELSTHEVALLAGGQLRGLRRLAAWGDAAGAILDGELSLPQIAALTVPVVMLTRAPIDGARFAARLPALRSIGVHVVSTRRAAETSAVAALTAIAAGPLGRQLDEVVVVSREPSCPLELDGWRASGCRLPVRFDLPYMTARFVEGRLVVEPRGRSAEGLLELALRDESEPVDVEIVRRGATAGAA